MNKKLFKFVIIIIILFSLLVAFNKPTITSFSRIIDPSEEDITTLSSRLDWWEQSLYIGMNAPLFGVGLRNYYEYLDRNNASMSSQKKFQTITLSHPHNIFFGSFAETGIVGLFATILLLAYFVKEDILSMKTRRSNFLNSLIYSFWILFSFSLFNPPDTLQYNALFWILRGIIYNLSVMIEQKPYQKMLS